MSRAYKIRGPGEYKTHNGCKVLLKRKILTAQKEIRWEGVLHQYGQRPLNTNWGPNGNVFDSEESPYDIAGRWGDKDDIADRIDTLERRITELERVLMT